MKCRSIPICIKSVSVSVPCKYSSMDQRSNYSIAAVCIVAINKRSTAPSSIMPPRTRSKQNKASRFRKEAAPKRNLTARATRRAQPAECWLEWTSSAWLRRAHNSKCWSCLGNEFSDWVMEWRRTPDPPRRYTYIHIYTRSWMNMLVASFWDWGLG